MIDFAPSRSQIENILGPCRPVKSLTNYSSRHIRLAISYQHTRERERFLYTHFDAIRFSAFNKTNGPRKQGHRPPHAGYDIYIIS